MWGVHSGSKASRLSADLSAFASIDSSHYVVGAKDVVDELLEIFKRVGLVFSDEVLK